MKVLGISGALRKASTNRLLLAEARRALGDCDWSEGDIRLPVFDEDIETGPGIPKKVQALADAIAKADAVVIASPEYNKSVAGGLKNALDWVSRTKSSPWEDKPVAILSANDGRAGGDRGQFALRLCLVPFRPRVLPGPEVMVADSRHAFDAAGRLLDARYFKTLTALMEKLKVEVGR